MGFKLQIRRGMEADLPQLDNGEVGYTQDTHKFFVGTPEGNRQLTFDQDKYDSLENLKMNEMFDSQAINLEGMTIGNFYIPRRSVLLGTVTLA